jgi:uncharacterized membrane protein YozB (DUF420 family)
MELALTFVRRTLYFVVIALVFSLAYNAVSYINFDPDFGFLRLKEKAIATGWYLPFYYSHVLIAGIILVVGLFQVYPDSHTKFKNVHRIAGYVYVMGILFFAAPGGLVMSLFIDRGPWVLTSFLLQSVLWFYFTATAFNKIRRGDITAHQHFMWRSYALTFAAITLRIYIFFTSWSVDLSQPSSYAALAWLSWVPNLFFVEGYIIWKRLNR